MLRPIELQPAGMQPTWYANGQRTHCSSGWFCPVVGHLGQACRLSTSSRDLIAIAIAEGGAHLGAGVPRADEVLGVIDQPILRLRALAAVVHLAAPGLPAAHTVHVRTVFPTCTRPPIPEPWVWGAFLAKPHSKSAV
jgi:hypothetical protein